MYVYIKRDRYSNWCSSEPNQLADWMPRTDYVTPANLPSIFMSDIAPPDSGANVPSTRRYVASKVLYGVAAVFEYF